MRILIVKLSSLGDVVHAMPAVQDLRHALAGRGEVAQIDWVVERGFAPLLNRCVGLERIIECELRAWRRSPLAAGTRRAWRAFMRELRAFDYDAVIDLQGLTKSVLVARLARLTPSGRRHGLANRTDGSSHEAPARWLVDHAIHIEPHVHVVQRSRELCARALDYPVPPQQNFGMRALTATLDAVSGTTPDPRPLVLLVHGTSRADKLWPEAHWIELAERLIAEGARVALAHGSDEELLRSQRLATRLGRHARVWPRLPLDELLDHMAAAHGVIGVDSGLSHVAVALGLPHVQIYNHDTAWRTGPQHNPRQLAVTAQPTPGVDQVWSAWQQVIRA